MNALVRRLPATLYLGLTLTAAALYLADPLGNAFLVALSFPWSLATVLEGSLAPGMQNPSSFLGLATIALGCLLNFKLISLFMECLDSRFPSSRA